MAGRRPAVVVAILTAVALVVFVAGPLVAGNLIASALRDRLTADFPAPAVVTVEVDAGSLPGLLGGRVPAVLVDVTGWGIDVEGRSVAVDAVELDLHDLQVDAGAAVAGALEQVEVARGTFTVTISAATFTGLLRDALERERPDLEPIAVDIDGANLALTVAGPGGESLVVQARPALGENRVVLLPLNVRDDDPAKGLANAIAGLGTDLPPLPLGLSYDELVLSPGGAVLRGELFQRVLPLS